MRAWAVDDVVDGAIDGAAEGSSVINGVGTNALL